MAIMLLIFQDAYVDDEEIEMTKRDAYEQIQA